ncbi:hypothetical protein V1478_013937 [Vespula squamosa]|uniref:Uncharacterized protein n=1 Tax=Vespula squamosa TaxID=30214 RepID=A0ABD2A6P1_VESSQ
MCNSLYIIRAVFIIIRGPDVLFGSLFTTFRYCNTWTVFDRI